MKANRSRWFKPQCWPPLSCCSPLQRCVLAYGCVKLDVPICVLLESLLQFGAQPSARRAGIGNITS